MRSNEIAVRLRIRGRVQGVWYRGWAEAEAMALGLDGWVRNRRDGTVEAVLRGPEAVVHEMIERCRTGPPAAWVERVDVAAETAEVAPGFHLRATL
jgi:acylphosphatase